MMYVTASANRELDEILDHIGVSLQLTPTQYQDAEGKYKAVGKWLGDPGSPLEAFDPDIFAQGSLRIDTTVKPLSHAEFDLDLVCLVQLAGVTPLQVYKLILQRVRSHGTYNGLIVELPRCVRLTYASQFHLDIVPAIPDLASPPGETCLLIPDREKRIWRPSNPKGYANWFERQAVIKLAANLYERKDIEPLREPLPAYLKPPLKLAVQLLKRWRDVAFQGREKLAPSSIILTTLAGHLYRNERHPTDALATILDGIHAWANQEDIRLKNPSNDKESITDRWNEKPEMYEAFLDGIFDLRTRWHKLIDNGRFPDFVGELKDLFEELPVTRAVKKFAESRGLGRGNGTLFMDKATGALSLASGPGVMRGGVKVKEHTFHGA